MRVDPDGVMRRLVRGMPAGTMGGTRRPDPVRERAGVTPTVITPADTISGGGGLGVVAAAEFSVSGPSISAATDATTTLSSGLYIGQPGMFTREVVSSTRHVVRVAEKGIYLVGLTYGMWIGGTVADGHFAQARLVSAFGFGTYISGVRLPGTSLYRAFSAPLVMAGITTVTGISTAEGVEVTLDRETSSGTASFAGRLQIAKLGTVLDWVAI